jgi:hypothetical protein
MKMNVAFFGLKERLLYVSILWVFIQMANYTLPLGFLYNSSLSQTKIWYPHVYLMIFSLSKLAFPFLYASWFFLLFYLWGGDKLNIKSHVIIAVLVLLGVFVYALPFSFVQILGVGLFVCSFLMLTKPLTLPIANGVIFLVAKIPFGAFFLFLLYIVACLCFPRFHPLAKYTMFNYFADTTHVYILRDEKDSLIPLRKYSTIITDELMNMGEMVQRKNNSKEIKLSESTEIASYFIQKSNSTPLPFDSIKVFKVLFYFDGSKLITNEKYLGSHYAH